jgi:probable addiction module antidote protein
MTKKLPKLISFDINRYLTDDAAIVEYLLAVLETGDSALLDLALGDVTRARSMSHGSQAS